MRFSILFVLLVFLTSCASVSTDSKYKLSLEKMGKTLHFVEQNKTVDALKTLKERSHFTCDSPCLTYRKNYSFYEFNNEDESFIISYVSAINQCAEMKLKNLNEVELCLSMHLNRGRNGKMDEAEFQKEFNNKLDSFSGNLKHRYFCQPFWGESTPRQSTTAAYYLLADSNWGKFNSLTQICSIKE